MTVGIVVVSHSAKLAEGVAELTREMAGADVRLAAAGGLDLPEHPLGTDAALIMAAIEQVYSDDGVIVLMDMGSAILSAEMARDMLPPEQREHVVLSEAPLIEGAIVAGVQARLGGSLEEVIADLRHSLDPKTSQLQPVAPAAENVPQPGINGDGTSLTLTVRNKLGLHARPAARFVQTVGRFSAQATVTNLTTGRGPVNARSINAVATLGVRQNHEIRITASGQDADALLAAVQALADNNFGDADIQEAPIPQSRRVAASQDGTLQGFSASSGLAIGPARLFAAQEIAIPDHTIDNPSAEWQALTDAISKTRDQIQQTLTRVRTQTDPQTAEIFEAHLMFLKDDALLEPAKQAIFAQKLNAAAAWNRSIVSMIGSYNAIADDYLRARAADLRDVSQQVLRNLVGQQIAQVHLTEKGILIAADLTPSDTAHLDPSLVMGICTALGGPTSHTAILARSLGIPAVVSLGDSILHVSENETVIVDGDSGSVIVQPDTPTLQKYTERLEALRESNAATLAASGALAMTADGQRVEVAANIGSAADALAAVAAGAEAVGLFRTEFLFLDRQTPPTEDEQFNAYHDAARALAGRSLIIRTLDVGGDKPLPYIDLGHEANPFLGWRAIRVGLAQPEMFKVQLRAIVRVAAEFPVRVMFPMIATLAEFRAAKALLAEAAAEVSSSPVHIETGIMVEIPSAAIEAERFAAEVDFFSIGTNDLTQYTLAAERGNPRVAALADAFQPAVLRLIGQVIQAAHASSKWVGVCGELAGDPLAIPLLVGLGIDELSMSAPAIPRAKQIVRTLTKQTAAALALEALHLETPDEIRQLVTLHTSRQPTA